MDNQFEVILYAITSRKETFPFFWITLKIYSNIGNFSNKNEKNESVDIWLDINELSIGGYVMKIIAKKYRIKFHHLNLYFWENRDSTRVWYDKS